MEIGSLQILTIGHSTRALADFINILKAHKIRTLVDVRTIARSRHNPQFNSETMKQALLNVRIRYLHMKGLGGLRHVSGSSLNEGWKNLSFRGFADYMQSEEFAENILKLLSLKGSPIAIMCAEAVPWRCHRSLIADALLIRGITVKHIMSETKTIRHKITPWARVEGGRITYPAQDVATE